MRYFCRFLTRAPEVRKGFCGKRNAVCRATACALLCACLVACLPPVEKAPAMEVFADFLHWRATQPVDWVLNTNRLPSDQFVAYETIDFDFESGFRAGVGLEGPWDAKSYYTRFHTATSDSASGNLTPAFMGGKMALSDDPASSPPYFDSGQVRSVIDYNMVDCDFGRQFNPLPSLQMRPIFGLRAGWIDQTFDAEFHDVSVSKSIREHIQNDFWGIGPKIGLENAWTVWDGEACRIHCVANFYTAYLLGHWSIRDVTHLTAPQVQSERVVPINDRDFGALTFQAVVGVHLEYGCWSAMAGYEINDWLNQCQIFDDATGPHNNDLLLQGLVVNVGCRF